MRPQNPLKALGQPGTMRERKAKPKAKKGQKSKAAQHRQSCGGRGGFMIALVALAGGAVYFRPAPTPTPVVEEQPEIVVGVVEELGDAAAVARDVRRVLLLASGRGEVAQPLTQAPTSE